MKRTIVLGAALALVLAAATGAFAAQKYLITSSSQIKPGSISYANLSATAKQRLAGQRGARGPAGAQGAQGPAGAQGPQGPAGAQGAQGPAGAQGAQGAAGSPGTKGDTGATGPAGPDDANALARSSGLVAWTADPALIIIEANDTSGAAHGSSVYLTKNSVITKLAELVVTPGAGMTHAMYGIYDKNLNRVAQTADTPADFETATNQWVELPLTTPYTVPATGLYYFVDLFAATGSTAHIGQISLNTATDARHILPGGTPRSVHMGGLSALPTLFVNDGTSVTRSIVAR